MAILPNSNQSVEDNFSNEKKFTIETNGVAFKVLSSSLYEKPVVAIVRELLSNAFDSHIAANNIATPVEIHLPTLEEAYFSITDYGTSLTEEEVYSIYTSFFSSTKRDNNNQTGCFGLGSKTPFAYSDTFTVTAVKDNVETFYVIYLKDNVPTITKISQKAIKAPNSFTVILSVKATDNYLFKSAAEEVLKYNTKPIKTNIELNTAKKDVIIKNNSTEVYSSNYFYSKQFVVKFNDINYYDVSSFIANIEQSLSNSDKTALTAKRRFTENYISAYVLVKDIPVGSICLTPNREEIIKNKENEEFLKAMYLESIEEAFNAVLYCVKNTLTQLIPDSVINKIIPTELNNADVQIKYITDLARYSNNLAYIINDLITKYLLKEIASIDEERYCYTLSVCSFNNPLQKFTFKLPTYHSYNFIGLYGLTFYTDNNVVIDLADIPKVDFVYFSKSAKPTGKTYEIIETLKENNNNKAKTMYITTDENEKDVKDIISTISKYLTILNSLVNSEQDIKVYTLEEYISKYEPKFENIAQLSRLYRRKGVKKDTVDYDNKKIATTVYGLSWGTTRENVQLKTFKNAHKYYVDTKLGAGSLLTVLSAIQNYYNNLLEAGVWNNNLIDELDSYFKENGYNLEEIANSSLITTTVVESKTSVNLIKKYAKKNPLDYSKILTIIMRNIPKCIAVNADDVTICKRTFYRLKNKYDRLNESSKTIVNKLFNLKQKIDFTGKITVKCMDGYLTKQLLGLRYSLNDEEKFFLAPIAKRKLLNFCDDMQKYFKLFKNEPTNISKRLVLNTIRKNNNRRIGYAKTILSSYDK